MDHNSDSLADLTPRPKPHVDRCICHEVPFQDILDWAADRGETTLADIEDQWGCGGSCGMCRPYLKQVLETGESRIPLMIEAS
ncbi:MAG: (2Fe-2S)-binding protein [Phycisphaerales bacterium]|jgi:bacterioferritin-associated ferredoxin|nr:(2Fe-2S)-binding protein [Phycisphaerales bacterium]